MRGLLQESVALFRQAASPVGAARSLAVLVYLLIEHGDYPEAGVLGRELIDSARALGDRRLLLSAFTISRSCSSGKATGPQRASCTSKGSRRPERAERRGK